MYGKSNPDRYRPTQEKLDALVRRIVELAHPLRIILFGSAARGEPTRSHDVAVPLMDGKHQVERRIANNVCIARRPHDIIELEEGYDRVRATSQ